MCIAILSDIHGNYLALERVLADVQRAGVEQIVCLGDVAFGGPQPHEVIRRLSELHCPVVMGNTDEYLIHLPTPDPNSESDQRILDQLLWAIAQLTRADLDFVRAFQPRVELALGAEKQLLCYHGSPRGSAQVILATTPEEELISALGTWRAAVMAGGHTHTQMLRRFQDWLLINPGSVGMPMQRDAKGRLHRPARAEYAIVRADGDDFGIEFRRVPLDVDAVVCAIRESGMPHGEKLVGEWEKKNGKRKT